MTELAQSIILEMRREHRAHIKRGLNWNPDCGICRQREVAADDPAIRELAEPSIEETGWMRSS